MGHTFSRREWLLSTVGTGLALTVSRPSSGAPGERPIELGFSLYGFPKTPVLDALKVIAETGYRTVELALLPNWPNDPVAFTKEARGEVKRALADLGLSLPALMDNLPLSVAETAFRDHGERIRRAAEVAHTLVPDAPPLLETVLGGKPGAWDEVKDAFAGRLAEWAKLAESLRLTIAVKAHAGNAMNRPEHLVWLLDQVASPWIRGAFDYSHFDGRGIPLDDAWSALAKQSVFVHVKDRAPGEAVKFLLPGEGTIDYARLFGLMMRDRYAGPVVVEVSGQIHSQPGYDPVAAAKKCFAALDTARKLAKTP
jgi:sugar phosphate isomerase/epimerase